MIYGIDFMTILIGLGLMLTGALFFGYPIGLRHGAKMVADHVTNRLDASEPFLVRDARRRLMRKPARSKGDALNAEVIE